MPEDSFILPDILSFISHWGPFDFTASPHYERLKEDTWVELCVHAAPFAATALLNL